MKVIVVALALMAVAAEGLTPEDLQFLIPEHYRDRDYSHSSDTDETGEFNKVPDENKPHDVPIARGSFSYINEHGETATISYSFDQDGYHIDDDSKGPEAVDRQ